MAFHDMELDLYGGSIRIKYTDKSHRYYARKRLLNEETGTFLIEDASNPKAWSKTWQPKGTTTLLGNTLEKNGLLKWPLGLAMSELFGYYNFVTDEGEKKWGLWGKKKGTLLNAKGEPTIPDNRDELFELVKHAYDASDRKKKQGADIGSLVHDAIEHYVKKMPFEITIDLYREGQEFEHEAAKAEWEKTAEAEVEMAKLALAAFKVWWDKSNITLVGAEDLIYSKTLDFCGTFDGLLDVPADQHPHADQFPGKKLIRTLADWKTSNASKSEQAHMHEGIGYSYFIQSAAYAYAWQEMGRGDIDDLLIVSCRKDGGFTTIYASDLGLTVEDCINWWRAVVVCFRMMSKTTTALDAHAESTGAKPIKPLKGAKK